MTFTGCVKLFIKRCHYDKQQGLLTKDGEIFYNWGDEIFFKHQGASPGWDF